jgi:hypothetical protein
MAQSPSRPKKGLWHAVSIVPRGHPCTAALALQKRRFLSRDAPPLPLRECTSPQICGCVYQHHEDRRAGPRRSSESTGFRGERPTTERRAGRGRRKSDTD